MVHAGSHGSFIRFYWTEVKDDEVENLPTKSEPIDFSCDKPVLVRFPSAAKKVSLTVKVADGRTPVTPIIPLGASAASIVTCGGFVDLGTGKRGVDCTLACSKL